MLQKAKGGPSPPLWGRGRVIARKARRNWGKKKKTCCNDRGSGKRGEPTRTPRSGSRQKKNHAKRKVTSDLRTRRRSGGGGPGPFCRPTEGDGPFRPCGAGRGGRSNRMVVEWFRRTGTPRRPTSFLNGRNREGGGGAGNIPYRGFDRAGRHAKGYQPSGKNGEAPKGVSIAWWKSPQVHDKTDGSEQLDRSSP